MKTTKNKTVKKKTARKPAFMKLGDYRARLEDGIIQVYYTDGLRKVPYTTFDRVDVRVLRAVTRILRPQFYRPLVGAHGWSLHTGSPDGSVYVGCTQVTLEQVEKFATALKLGRDEGEAE